MAFELKKESLQVDLYDPWVEADLFHKEYDLKVVSEIPKKKYDALALAVSHDLFEDLDMQKLKKNNDTFVYDIKSFFNKGKVTERL